MEKLAATFEALEDGQIAAVFDKEVDEGIISISRATASGNFVDARHAPLARTSFITARAGGAISIYTQSVPFQRSDADGKRSSTTMAWESGIGKKTITDPSTPLVFTLLRKVTVVRSCIEITGTCQATPPLCEISPASWMPIIRSMRLRSSWASPNC